jgi:hypothetical protein
MGEAEINSSHGVIIIHSHIITYGHAANEELTEQMRIEIETMWNEPGAIVPVQNKSYRVHFRITAEAKKDISDLELYQNTDPRNNYFRIEEFAHGNISFVDGLGCNSGYFKLENLYKDSTTAAHEYGHTLGLDHPHDLDIRGKGVPGIMYPRGTLVDARFQYDPSKPAGVTGGTLHPMHRRVSSKDILDLKINKLRFSGNKTILGAFTNIYHWDHSQNNL